MRVREVKTWYPAYVLGHLHRELPHAVSYPRFVELMPTTVGPRYAYVQTCYGL
jgi:hypothetical protein